MSPVFCTLFDSRYLSRGLTMYQSLKRWCPSASLFVYAFDDLCYSVLASLRLEGVAAVPLSMFEDERLKSVKSTRSRTEYCWTCTPSIIRHTLSQFGVDECTYVDADLFFMSPPDLLLKEMSSSDHILLTEHRYTPRFDQTKKAGRFCVQFMTFRRTREGMRALEWWRERCLEWCYNRYEDGRFGDQKYLDDWTERFPGVHVLNHEGGGLAPWNIQQYVVYEDQGRVMVRNRKSGAVFPAVFYHFHYLRFYEDGSVDLGRYPLSPRVIQNIYRPYLRELFLLAQELSVRFPGEDFHGCQPFPMGGAAFIEYWKRFLKGAYHVYRSRRLERLLWHN